MKQITFERDGLTAVARERLGRDETQAVHIHSGIGRAIVKRQGAPSIKDIPDLTWGDVIAVTPLIQQIVSLEGNWPFTRPASESDDDLYVFYKAVLDAPARYLKTLQDALKEADDSPFPNQFAPAPDKTVNDESGTPSLGNSETGQT